MIDALRWQLTTDPGGNEADLAGATMELVRLLGWAGREEERAAAEQEALSLNRRLAVADPLAFGPGLSLLLEERMGRTDGDARIDTLAEVTALYRRLADLDTARFGAAYLETSGDIATRLWFARRHDAAAAAARDHVDACRRFDAPGHKLVSACIRAALMLGSVDQGLDALRFQEEAVAAQRVLAATDPADADLADRDQHGDLAHLLETLADLLADAGRAEDAQAARDEALAAREVAVGISRDRAGEDFATHGDSLRSMLDALARQLAARERHDDALAAHEEAVAVCRRLEHEETASHPCDLPWQIEALATRLVAVGRHDEALAAQDEAITVFRRLAGDDESRYGRWLARAAARQADRLADVRRHADALVLAHEAVAIDRRLAAAEPEHEYELARSLNVTGNVLGGLGRHAEAVTAKEESVSIRRRRADADPEGVHGNLAASLANLARDLKRVGRDDEALAMEQEAVDILRPLGQRRSREWGPSLGTALNNVACTMSARGRHDEALAASAESVATYRRLAAAPVPKFAVTLWTFAEVRAAAGLDLDAALDAAEEAVALYERLSEHYAESLRGARATVADVLAARAG